MRELFERRRAAIEAQVRAQRFFAELEERVEPRAGSPLARTWIDRLQAWLWARVGQRAHLALRVVPAAPRGWVAALDRPRGVQRRALEEVERVVRSTVVEHYGPTPVDAGLGWGFEAFVAGRLATVAQDAEWNAKLVTHGAPNSANFFLFCELAWACVECGLEVAFWDATLDALVPSAHLLSLYPDGVDGDRPDHVPRFGHYEGRVLPVAEIERVRRAYLPVLRADAATRRARLEDSWAKLLERAVEHPHPRTGGEHRPVADPVLVD